MKIILTEEDVKKAVVNRLIRSGQLLKEVDYKVEITSYSKDFMIIEAPEPKKDGDK